MTSNDTVDLLLVEDDPDDLELALETFHTHHPNTRIQVARDGEEALDFLLCMGPHIERSPHNGPLVVVLDLKLPKVDGLDVLRQIKADARTRTIPVVMLTSSQQEIDIRTCYQLGVNSYLVKAVEFERYSEEVRCLGRYWLLLNKPPPI